MKLARIALTLFAITLFQSSGFYAQEITKPREDKNFRLEIEPSSFALRGFAGSLTYNITKYDDINVGLYLATLDIPKLIQTRMFDNIGDTADVRLGFEAALMFRFKLNMFKKMESNPYVGMIVGWEYFDIKQPNMETLTIKTGIATPYVGYELYVYKQILYVNPQLRSVFYFNPDKSDITRSENLVDCYLLPQIALGIRL